MTFKCIDSKDCQLNSKVDIFAIKAGFLISIQIYWSLGCVLIAVGTYVFHIRQWLQLSVDGARELFQCLLFTKIVQNVNTSSSEEYFTLYIFCNVIVMCWWGGHCCLMHCDFFKIYCAPPNLDCIVLYCIVLYYIEGVVIAAQCTATFRDLLCSLNLDTTSRTWICRLNFVRDLFSRLEVL